MSEVIPTKAQLAAKSKFGNAVAYAKKIMGHAEEKLKANMRLNNRKASLYPILISEFMKNQHKNV